jgi:hypothetical protein
MRTIELLSVSLIGVAAAVGVVGCGSSSSPAAPGSAAGQSCTRTADCAGTLVCISNTCFPAAISSTSLDSGVDGSSSAEGGTITTQGGPEQLGQACAASSDCATGLTCVPFSSAVGGLCDYANFGINPDAGTTGKVCGGECQTSADCCELPPPNYGSSASFANYSDGGLYLGSTTVYTDQCAAILQAIGGSTAACSSLSPSNLNNSSTSKMCYYYQTYCASTCSTNWSCSNNACVYTGGCTLGSGYETSGACAYYTRTGKVVNETCIAAPDAGMSVGTPGSCGAAATTCTTSADCNGQTIADPQVLDNEGTTCAGGDCTCVQNKCYFSCAQDIDCAGGYSCNTTSHLCTQATPTGCMTNNDCVTVSVAGMGTNAKAICNTTTHACAVPCMTDHDCSLSSGAVPSLGRFSGYVCSNNYCTAVSTSAGSCSTNADCQGMSNGGVNTFCVTPSTPAVTESAISGGKGM